ncbi:hypothetical protein OJF2_72910 [Aquisphaera giovannonii]|uniref:Lipoprotein n=1 Tax=Aquisphaera giovannonii TaxID=406548 RepID=A0A5B9WF46_9BACT|nr:hypothetical protein [Aquisphaera giovannonii]QEH38685.1 hypothetical protein OJF2_72910 [Aquisphaera giovannonii]
MIRFAWVSGLAVLLAGCGGSGLSTDNPGTPPPHGGEVINLPGAKGHVEVVRKSSARGDVSFYFFKDSTTPYSPAPTSGTLTVGKKQVSLKPEGEGLATPPGADVFPRGALDGSLTVELAGEKVTIPLGVR